MVICVEGIDRTGKSTQIKKMQEYFEELGLESAVIHYEGVKVPESGPFKSGAQEVASRTRYDDMLHLADEMVKSTNHVLIFDRAHLGEFVYSPMYRHYDGDYVFELEKKYPNFCSRALLFTFIDTPEHVLARDDGESFTTDLQKKAEEIDRFTAATVMSNVEHKHLINIKDKSIDDVWNIIKPQLQERIGR